VHLAATIKISAVLMGFIAFVLPDGHAVAQPGSSGGSIGNDEKAVSGLRPRPSNERGQPHPSEKKGRRAAPTRSNVAGAPSGCVLVRTQTSTMGCYGFVGYSKGVRVGWLRRQGMWVRSGSGERCRESGIAASQLGPDSVRLSDGTRMRLDATCRNGQDF
jgi:hypothetical protein